MYPFSFPTTYEPVDLRLPPPTFDDFPDTLPPPPVARLSGNLDPTTGIFYHMPENPRIRTAQACDNCRSRKAKCSGDHPSCARCVARGLLCEYTKEIKPRAPSRRPRGRPPGRTGDSPSKRPSHERAAKKRRRNTTVGEPLSSCVPLPLVFPAHLNVSDSDKHLSLPAPLDLNDMNLIAMSAGDAGHDAYDESDARSRRSSHSSFDGAHDTLDFDSHKRFFEAGKQLPLESGYALHRGGMQNGDPGLMHIDPVLRPQSFGVHPSANAHPTAPLGVGMELLLAPQTQSLGPRDYFRPGSGSSSSASGSSYDGDNSSAGPDSAIEGGFPLFHQGHHAPHSVSPQSAYRQYHPQTQLETPPTFFDYRSGATHASFDMQGLQGVSSELASAQYGYVAPHDAALFSQYQQQLTSQVSFTPSDPTLAYPTWGTKAYDYTLKPLPSVAPIGLHGWVEPPSMPLSGPVRHMPVAMPVPSRVLMQRGVSGLSVVIPESSVREEGGSTSGGSSWSSKDDSVPSSVASSSTSASSAASSPLSSVPDDIDVPGEAEGAKGARTGGARGPAPPPPPIGRASPSDEVKSVAAPPGTGNNSGGRKRGQTVSGAGDV